MNRRQFTQSLAALFAAPALPAVSLAATPTGAAPASAYFWADYMTRMHTRCTPDMLAPFFKADTEAAKLIHSQLVSENVLTSSGHAHPNLLARQPQKTFGQRDFNRPNSQTKKPVNQRQTSTMADTPDIRPATDQDHDALTDIWHDGWHESHAAHVPTDLTDMRTHDSFHDRLVDMLPTTLVAGPIGAPIGFCAIRNNEIYQMYVSPAARGTGAAAALILAGCDAIKDAGYATAQLDVIEQNARARAFYEKIGFVNHGEHPAQLDTQNGIFELPCILMEKDL